MLCAVSCRVLCVRHMLSAGQVLQVYTKGSAKACHVLIAPDWKSIVWQDPKNAKKIGAMDMRTVSAIHAGVGEGHKCVSVIVSVIVIVHRTIRAPVLV